MELLTQLFGEMTLWKWIALIGFILALFGAANAFFGLRGRFLDWRAIKGQASFNDRLESLARDFRDYERKDMTGRFSYLAYVGALATACAVAGVGFGILGIYLTLRTPPNGDPFVFMLSLPLLGVAFILLISVTRKAFNFDMPDDTTKSLFKLLKKGIVKGFITDVEPIVGPLRDSKIWTKIGKDSIEAEILELKAWSAKIAIRKG
jgi:hypothetical protein